LPIEAAGVWSVAAIEDLSQKPPWRIGVRNGLQTWFSGATRYGCGVTQPARQRFTFAEYVQLDADTGYKHEFLDGMVWAMAGGSPDHAAIAGNVLTLLNNQLRGQRCRAYTSDLRIRVLATGLGTYPDASVVCDELALDPEDPKGHTVTNPRVLVEVLSPSTEEYDRSEKLDHYRQIPSLAEILLVAYDQRRVQIWRREGDRWSHTEIADDGVVALSSLGCELPLTEIYRDPLGQALL
jgi:Uma2 family endonuclease